MEGPRPLRAGELPSLVRLLNRTFRSNFPGNFLEEYPHILNEANLNRLIVMSEGGEIVSHVGMVSRQISFEGVPLAAALVGAVATAEECRGSGCATRCLDFALDQAAREGDDFAWISGGRGLYTSRGAAVAGREWIYQVATGRKMPEGMAIREISIEGNPAVVALYEREPAHFLRERSDWSLAAKSRFVLNSKSRFWGVFRADRLCAYLIVHEPRPDRPAMVLAEFAGDRMDAARALPEVAARMAGAVVQAHVGDWDRAGREAFAAVASDEGKLEAGRGTFLPLREAPCMEKLRPRIARLCGEAVAGAGLKFSESGDGPGTRFGADARLHISFGQDEVHIAGRAQLARFLFGAPDSKTPAFEGAASVIEKLQPAFPLPTPWYGLNYV
jgi:predicted N-acetyltransferase YhbS